MCPPVQVRALPKVWFWFLACGFETVTNTHCFVCGEPIETCEAVLAMVHLRHRDKIIALFGKGVKADDSSPEQAKMSVAACSNHTEQLQTLYRTCFQRDIIDEPTLKALRSAKP